MKLIEKLPPGIYQGRKVYSGVYECSLCGKHVERACGHGSSAKTCGCHPYKGKEFQKADEKAKADYKAKNIEGTEYYTPSSDKVRSKGRKCPN